MIERCGLEMRENIAKWRSVRDISERKATKFPNEIKGRNCHMVGV